MERADGKGGVTVKPKAELLQGGRFSVLQKAIGREYNKMT